jgi:hypothetical protein
MTTFLVGAVLLLCLMAVWCVKIITASPNPNSTPAWGFAGVSLVIALKLLLSMLQAEFVRRDIRADLRQTRHDLRGELNANSLKMDEVVRKTNGGLSNAVEKAGEQVRLAEREQMMNDPKFKHDLAMELCPMLAEQVTAGVLKGLSNPPPQTPTVQT